jgi:hypothetical protein
MQIAATFFVGLSGGRWEHTGSYIGSGADVEDAAAEALARCAGDYADRAVIFTTFASIQCISTFPNNNAPSLVDN